MTTLVKQGGVRNFASAILGANAFVVRAIFFDKVPDHAASALEAVGHRRVIRIKNLSENPFGMKKAGPP